MAALTKAEIAELLYTELGLNKREAKELVEHFFEEIRTALESNDPVKLSSFRIPGPGVTPRPARRSPSLHAVW